MSVGNDYLVIWKTFLVHPRKFGIKLDSCYFNICHFVPFVTIATKASIKVQNAYHITTPETYSPATLPTAAPKA